MACGTNGACGCSGGSMTGYGGCSDSCPSVQIFDWLPGSSKEEGRDQCDLIEVAFKKRRRKVYQNIRRIPVQAGDEVIVSAQRGLDYGRAVLTGELVHLRTQSNSNLGQILRLASSHDRTVYLQNKEAETKALITAKSTITRRQMPIKLVDAEWQFDRKRLSFFYASSERVSMHSVIRELCRRFQTRVELLRLNPRQEAARVGGLGVCGRELCCSSWMRQIPPVSASAAKNMHFPLTDERLQGRCGQLKCCLNYELEQYMKILKEFPRRNSKVETAQGSGRVINMNIFSRTVRVKFDSDMIEEFELGDLKYPTQKRRATRGKKSSHPKKKRSR